MTMSKTRRQALLDGDITVDDLGLDELLTGRLNDKNGTQRRGNPASIPRAIHDSMVRELLKRGESLFRESYAEAIEVMRKVMLDDSVDPRERLKAAQYVVERFAGKVPDKVEVSTSDPWQQVIDQVMITSSDEDEPYGMMNGNAVHKP